MYLSTRSKEYEYFLTSILEALQRLQEERIVRIAMLPIVTSDTSEFRALDLVIHVIGGTIRCRRRPTSSRTGRGTDLRVFMAGVCLLLKTAPLSLRTDYACRTQSNMLFACAGIFCWSIGAGIQKALSLATIRSIHQAPTDVMLAQLSNITNLQTWILAPGSALAASFPREYARQGRRWPGPGVEEEVVKVRASQQQWNAVVIRHRVRMGSA